MDNMHARMRVPEREQPKPAQQAAAAQDEPRQYVPSRPTAHDTKRVKKRGLGKWLLSLLAVLVVLALLFGAWKYMTANDGIDHGKYQIVFLANGSSGNTAYVGKLSKMPDGYFKLTDVFYFQTNTPTDNKDATAADIKMIKPGEEVHAPEDTIVIPREQVLHYENLKDTGKVAEAIKKYHEGQR